MENRSQEQQDLLDSDNQSLEDLTVELEEQQQRLLTLKRQQEEVERRKQELEEINKRRSELTLGQKSMRDKLTRAITVLERAEYQARKEIEQIEMTRETFVEHLKEIETITPQAWSPEEIDDELTRSLSKIDNARAAYTQSRAKLDALSGRDIENPDDNSSDEDEDGEESYSSDIPFKELVRRGLALSLPLILFFSALAVSLFYLISRS